MDGKLIDIIWKLEYPISMILAFLVFFIPLQKKKDHWPCLVGGILLVFLISLVRVVIPFGGSDVFSIFFYLINPIILFFIFYLCVDYKDVGAFLFITSCVIALQHISYKITVGIFVLIDPNLLSATKVYIPTLLVISIVCALMTYFFFSKKLKIADLYTNSIYMFIGILLLLVSTIIVNYFEYDIFFLNIPRIKLISFLINFSSIITTLIILMFLYVTALNLSRKKENSLIKLLASKDKERYELMKMSAEDINIKYHDLQHALKNYELDEELRNEIKESTTNYKAIINTSNRGLNVVVYESQLKCIAKEIDLNVLIDGDPLSFMKSHHVYTFLSNLLDNSIEAVEKISDKDKRRISLKIIKKNNNVFINVTNFINAPIKFVDNYPITSKKDKLTHGYGIKSVEQIINKYNGNMAIKNIDDQFIIDILIPIAEIN